MEFSLKKLIKEGIAGLTQKGSGDSVFGIDVGSSSIKVVQLRKKSGKAILETYGTLALGPYEEGGTVGQITNLPPEKIALALTDLMREAQVTASTCSLSIPSTSSLMLIIDVPSTIDEKEFGTVIPTEARKYIPVPMNEISLDWWMIPKSDAESSGVDSTKNEVLIAAVHNDALERNQQIMKEAKLVPAFYEIEVFSLLRSVLGRELTPVMIVDVGAGKTKVSIVEFGVVRSFHIINRGGNDITSALSKSLALTYNRAEELKREFGMKGSPDIREMADVVRVSVDYILAEVNTVILSFEKKYQRSISKVVFTGGGAMLTGFSEYAGKAVSVPVTTGNPFSKVEVPKFLESVLSSIGPEYSTAVGLAIRLLK
jgi:type IV pilus assembly protein PilM